MCHFKIAVNSIYLDSEDLHFSIISARKTSNLSVSPKTRLTQEMRLHLWIFFLFLKTFLAGCPIYLICSSHSKTNMMNFRFNFKRVMTINWCSNYFLYKFCDNSNRQDHIYLLLHFWFHKDWWVKSLVIINELAWNLQEHNGTNYH